MLNNLDKQPEENGPEQTPNPGEPIREPEAAAEAEVDQTAQNFKPTSQPPVSSPSSPQIPTQQPQKTFSIAELNEVNYEMLVDVPIKVSVELGRSQMTVKEILALEKGSVIELNRIAGDPVDVFVNDYLIAKGEVVVVDDNFGVRITQIMASHSLVGKN